MNIFFGEKLCRSHVQGETFIQAKVVYRKLTSRDFYVAIIFRRST